MAAMRRNLDMNYRKYFKAAVCAPAVLLPALLLVDALYFSPALQGGWVQYLQIYVLGFGLAACWAFVPFAWRRIDRRSEPEVLRLAWWAPLMFVPFYAVPWVLYGLAYLATGRVAGLGIMLSWLAYLPYVLVVAYLFSGASVLGYRMIAK